MSKDTKKFIKEFIRHVEILEAEEDPEGNGFNKEYRMIHEVQVRNRRENAFSMDVGRIETNLKKNRYKDILPYDEHRVILKPVEGEEDSDYINASKLTGVKGTGGYIASQGPLATTVIDFWRMIWEYNIEIIFMACRIVELGKIKCKQYWNDVNKSEDFGDISVYTETEEEIASDFIQRKLRVTKGEETRMVTQFHYSGWPDHGIPDDPAHIRDLIGIMRRTRQNDEAPLLIHCSAGCGRTGAIAAIDYVWTLLEEGRFDEKFNLYELICNFREQRMSIVQTAEQYALVNQVLKSLCEEWLTKMASHTYENVLVDSKESVPNSEGESENIYDFGESSVNTKGYDLKEGNQGPEIINLPTPMPQTNQNYENLILRSRAPSEKAPAPPPPSNNNPKKSLQYVTVTQVGSSPQHLPQGLNYVKKRVAPQPEKPIPSHRTSLKTETSPNGDIYATVKKGTPSHKSEESTEQPPAGAAIYSTVNKQPPKISPVSSAVEQQPPSAPFPIPMIPTKRSGSPLGFLERLPKVSGPKPMPFAWTSS